ncbi:MAG: response regulator [Verrucomicrobia bacterium]|jgi:signal transduction histidine kinase|nr:response regulator [Verrucomicrobiota bacterium]
MPTDAISVLLVEDDEDDYLIMSQLLKEARQTFCVEWRQTLGEGIASLSDNTFDVVILDLTLPDSSGWETFTTMREQAPSLPVILMTGLEDNDLAIRAVHEGAQDYLVKGSVGTDVMVRAIQYAIERKATEADLRRYQDHLEELVHIRTHELEQTNAKLTGEITVRKQTEQSLRQAISQLEEHDRAKTQFVTNVSHELKTPLASMSYAVDNLLKGVMGPVPDRVRTYLEMVRDDAQRLHRTISDILDLSRLEADIMRLEQATIPYSRFVRRTLDAAALELEEREVTLQRAIPPDVGFAACDATKMERVILNVVRNAITYTDPGGTIEVSLSSPEASPEMIQLSVTDSGIGIPEAFLQKVTERYFRVGDHVDGMGLGLSIAKEIIALHGGEIAIESPPPGAEQGTRVTLSIPPASEVPTIVAVDDDSDVLSLIHEQLAADGYNVETTPDPSKAAKLLTDGKADILLIDLVMPQISGDTFIAEVKADHRLRHVPVVVLTGAELDLKTRETLERFSVPALAKPWKQEALLDTIEGAIIGKHYLAR